MVDFFQFFLGNLSFLHCGKSPDKDFLTDNKRTTNLTQVVFTEKDMYSIFYKYTSEGVGFDVTNVPLQLMQLEGENLFSRSQTKHLIRQSKGG